MDDVKEWKFWLCKFDDERFAGLDVKSLDRILQAIYELHGEADYIILNEPQKRLGTSRKRAEDSKETNDYRVELIIERRTRHIPYRKTSALEDI